MSSPGSDCQVTLNFSSKDKPTESLLSVLILTNLLNQSLTIPIKVEFSTDDSTSPIQLKLPETETGSSSCLSSSISAISSLSTQFAQYSLAGTDSTHSNEIKSYLNQSTIDGNLLSDQISVLSEALDSLDDQLSLRTFLTHNGHLLTAADVAVYSAIRSNPKAAGLVKQGRVNLKRWLDHFSRLQAVVKAEKDFKENERVAKEKLKGGAEKSAKVTSATTSSLPTPKGPTPAVTSSPTGANASFDLFLPSAKKGGVVTRFPPEPSGYLHVGHAKAAILNQYFATQYEGRLVIRFDDTNPSKEKAEFEDSIVHDLELLGIKGDVVTHTSDYFDELYKLAIGLIKKGDAYADDTEQEEMRAFRKDGIPSKRRELSIEDSLARFAEMTTGSIEGQKWCLRAKMSVDDPNKALRDPVIYRCNDGSHHRTGTTWKVYPTYDFACPVVDSMEGITHALRTNEYRDRNPQYQWFLDHLDLRKVEIWDYSRLNFVYTLLSKRKLQWFVDNGHVSGWDDPRFPTVRGIRRRGMTIPCIRQFIIAQGPSQAVNLQEWDAIWTINKRMIDPVVPRYTAISEGGINCSISGEGINEKNEIKELPLHKKNEELGLKKVTFSKEFRMEKEDCETIEVGEELTLMDWGNAILKEKVVKDGQIQEMKFQAKLSGDFKKTRKFTWLSLEAENQDSISKLSSTSTPIVLLDYDYLITKKKLEETDAFSDFLTPETEFRVSAIGDVNITSLKVGDRLQFERKGYYILDKITENGIREFIKIPDGSQKNSASKAAPDEGVEEKKRKAKEERDKKKAEKEKKEKEKKEKKEKAKADGVVAGAASAVTGAAVAAKETAKKGAEKVKVVVKPEEKEEIESGKANQTSVVGDVYKGHNMYHVDVINSDTLETPTKTSMYHVNRVV